MKLVLTFALLYHISLTSALYEDVTIVDSSYKGIVIAINPSIPKNVTLLNAIKAAWTEASVVLFTATKKRVYFGEITILVPKSWEDPTYGKAITETYDNSDVLVEKPGNANKNEPYTINAGQCGEHGLHMYFTPEYLINPEFLEDWGPRGKTIVHEWAHLRWGVFDETAQPGGEKFYLDGTGNVKATKRPTPLDGELLEIDFNTGRVKDCTYDDATSLPNQDCSFVPYPPEEQPAGLTTSLMSQQYMGGVNFFCHDDPTDPINQHNTEAPNAQNRLCQQRSTWSVIMTSPDFANGVNPPYLNTVDTRPVFRIVKPHLFRMFVLVLDTSGSMDGERLIKMLQTVRKFIQDFVSDGDHVGIVTFSSHARKKNDLILVHRKSDREQLISSLPKSVRGSTCIGCGINEAIAVMEDGSPGNCGDIIIFTDGEENKAPYVNDVLGKVKQNNCTVNAIFFTTNGNADLQKLVTDTRGQWFFSSEVDITSLIHAFGKLASSQDGDHSAQTSTIVTVKHEVNAQQTVASDAVIDATVGKDTVFEFLWSERVTPVVTITAPSGCRYSTDKNININMCAGHPLAVTDDKLKIIRFNIPDIAEEGKWRYEMTSSTAQSITASVTSKSRDKSVKPIIVKGGLTQLDIKKAREVVAFARVTQGGLPVVGAEVEMIVGRPDGTNIKLQLFDKGDVPDQKKNDGIYSRYFTGYTAKGRYTVTISLTGKSGKATNQVQVGLQAAFKYGYITKSGDVILNSNGNKNQPKPVEETVEEIGDFTRVVAGNSFSYSGALVQPDEDIYAPNRIGDLRVRQADINDPQSAIVITFTSPGDDLDSGRADHYTIEYQFVGTNDSAIQITPEDLLSGNLTRPLESSSKESFLLKTPNITQQTGVIKIGFTIYATDDRGNIGEKSFQEVLNFYLEPPIKPTLPPIIRVVQEVKPARHSRYEVKRWCQNSYRRAYRRAYDMACGRYAGDALRSACRVAQRQYHRTRDNFHYNCENLSFDSACKNAFYEACSNYYCNTCYQPYRNSYYLYN